MAFAPAATLRELHRLRRFAKELEEEIQRLPQQQKIQENRVARQEEGLKNHHETIKKTKVSIHEKEVSLKTAHQQISKQEKQRNEAGGKKEYDALGAEIATARQNCQKLEDEILTLMTEVDDKTAQIPQLEATLKQALRFAATENELPEGGDPGAQANLLLAFVVGNAHELRGRSRRIVYASAIAAGVAAFTAGALAAAGAETAGLVLFGGSIVTGIVLIWVVRLG